MIRNLPYSEAGRRGHLDIYLPAGDDAIKDAPVLLQVHGGAWTLGAKEHQGRPLMNRMAAKGWVCVAINYRLAPRDPWPAHIVDVKRAIAWVRDNIADYGGDPDYLVITGGSAGGHLTALAALTPGDPQFQPGFEDADTSVQAAVPFYGVYDFAGSTGLANAIGMRDAFLGPRVMQTTWKDAPDVYEAASPILRITPDAPDFFVIHGELDSLVAVDQARMFVAELRRTSREVGGLRRAAGRPARLRRLPLDPQRPRGARRRPLPHLALEHLAPRPRGRQRRRPRRARRRRRLALGDEPDLVAGRVGQQRERRPAADLRHGTYDGPAGGLDLGHLARRGRRWPSRRPDRSSGRARRWG